MLSSFTHLTLVLGDRFVTIELEMGELLSQSLIVTFIIRATKEVIVLLHVLTRLSIKMFRVGY